MSGQRRRATTRARVAAGRRRDDELMSSSDGLRPVRAWLCLGLMLGLPLLLRAAEPAPKTVEPADDDLIEFLGSVDSDDEGWRQYLRRTGIAAASGQEAAAGAAAAAVRPGKTMRKMCTRPGLLGALLLTGPAVGRRVPAGARAEHRVPQPRLHRAGRRRALEFPVAGPAASAVAAVWPVGAAARRSVSRHSPMAASAGSACRRTSAPRRGSVSINGSNCRRSAVTSCASAGRSSAPCRRPGSRPTARISGKFQQLPQERRQQLRQRWQKASPAQRRDMVDRARARSVQRAPKLR